MKIALTLSAALLALGSFAQAHDEHAPAAATHAGHEHAGHGHADDKAHQAAMVAAQKICPVTGLDLHAMGGPYKAKSGDRTLFLCCKSCLGKQPKPEALTQIKANLKTAQGLCPIMKKPLPKDAESTVVAGHTVFVCCEGCIDKVKADPDAAVHFVDAQYRKHAEHAAHADKH